MATLDPISPFPHVRSHIFRTFLESEKKPSLPLLVTTTDIRTPKIQQMLANPHAELAWWIEPTQEQFRISGLTTVVPEPGHTLHDAFLRSAPSALPKPEGLVATGMLALKDSGIDWEGKRVEVFKMMSPYMRAAWCRPTPGSPLDTAEGTDKWPVRVDPPTADSKEEDRENWTKALKNFALVIIDPDRVDYVEMAVKPNRRWYFTRTPEGSWEELAVVP